MRGTLKKQVRKIQRCLDDPNISEANRKTMIEFDEYLIATGRREGTRCNYVMNIWDMAKWLGDKPFKEDDEEATKQNLMKFVIEIQKKLKPNTLNAVKLRLRRFYKWLYGITKKHEYPKCTEWMEFKTFGTEVDVDSFHACMQENI